MKRDVVSLGKIAHKLKREGKIREAEETYMHTSEFQKFMQGKMLSIRPWRYYQCFATGSQGINAFPRSREGSWKDILKSSNRHLYMLTERNNFPIS